MPRPAPLRPQPWRPRGSARVSPCAAEFSFDALRALCPTLGYAPCAVGNEWTALAWALGQASAALTSSDETTTGVTSGARFSGSRQQNSSAARQRPRGPVARRPRSSGLGAGPSWSRPVQALHPHGRPGRQSSAACCCPVVQANKSPLAAEGRAGDGDVRSGTRRDTAGVFNTTAQ